MSKLRTTLLAAIALLPAVATAQTPPPDRGRPEARYDRPGGPPPTDDARPDRGPGGWQGRDAGPRPGGREGDRRGGDDRFRGGPDRPGLAPGQPGPDRPDRWSGNDPRRDGRGPGWDGRGPGWDDRRDGRGWNDRGPGWDRRGGYDGRQFAGRPGWNDGRGYGGYANWRGDRRYDWQGWRNQNRALFRGPRYVAPRGYGYRPFSVGYRLDPFFYGQSYWLNDPYRYHLPPAYGPYQWVRYFDDVMLVDVRSGIVADVINQFFW